MSTLLRTPNDAVGRDHAGEPGLHDHLLRTAEVRQRRVEAIARGVVGAWTSARHIVERLIKSMGQAPTPAANGKRRAATLGRATVADALARDLRRLVGLVRRYVLEPYGRRRRRGIAIAQLRSLDEHVLADIGLTRGQIELAVDGMLPRRGEIFSRPVKQAAPAEEVRHELRLAA